MKINWMGYFHPKDGYGRFNYRMVKAFARSGVNIKAVTPCHMDMPTELQEAEGVFWDRLTISCLPPIYLRTLTSPHWLYSMTEGSRIPDKWVEAIELSGVERVIVPCQHNAEAFRDSGVTLPISVVEGGVEPAEFPLLDKRESYRPYTFLTFADRGGRKGWEEVWEAFYKAFGGKTTGNQDVRLIIKSRPEFSALISQMGAAEGADSRISYFMSDVEDMRGFYTQAHCLVLPSRSEGWGMIQREAAATGLPVITQKYSGLDDGFTEKWSLVVRQGSMKTIPPESAHGLGNWRIADVGELAERMLQVYDSPQEAEDFGREASFWLKKHQTWNHSVFKLTSLVREHGYE